MWQMMPGEPTDLRIQFLINEYNALLEEHRIYARTEWRILLAFLASTGAGIASLHTLFSLNSPALQVGTFLLSLTFVLLGMFLAVSVYKARLIDFVNIERHGEIEELSRGFLGLTSDVPWGRFGTPGFERLWKKVSKAKGYKRMLRGIVDYGIMWILGFLSLAWSSPSLWMLLGALLPTQPPIQVAFWTLGVVAAIEVVWTVVLFRLAWERPSDPTDATKR